jgi:hypothetical protein
MQSQIIFIIATFAYFTAMVYSITPSITPFDSVTTIFLLCVGLSAGYVFLTQKMNAGGLSYLALTVLYATVLVVFLFIYALNPRSLLVAATEGTYENLILTPRDISSNQITVYSKYKNTASPAYSINLNIKLSDPSEAKGTLFERQTVTSGLSLLKVEIIKGGKMKITTADKNSNTTTTMVESTKTQFSSTNLVPFTFVMQPQTLTVYRDKTLIHSVSYQTSRKPPTKEDNKFVIGKIPGGSLDIFRFTDTNIL